MNRAHRGCDALAQVVPASTELLLIAAERGHNLGQITAALLRLLDQYGAASLQAAVLVAVARQVPHPNAVRLALAHERERAGRPPALALALPEHLARRDAPMCTHSLASYDRRDGVAAVPGCAGGLAQRLGARDGARAVSAPLTLR